MGDRDFPNQDPGLPPGCSNAMIEDQIGRDAEELDRHITEKKTSGILLALICDLCGEQFDRDSEPDYGLECEVNSGSAFKITSRDVSTRRKNSTEVARQTMSTIEELRIASAAKTDHTLAGGDSLTLP